MPRKTNCGRAARRGPARAASMRPRPDAAENARIVGAGLANMPASMRPRPDAAENDHRARHVRLVILLQ